MSVNFTSKNLGDISNIAGVSLIFSAGKTGEI